jgi:SAM-dependent methyltransferase
MTLQEKLSLLSEYSDEQMDQLFGIDAVTDVPKEGPEDLYLKGIDAKALYSSYKDLTEIMVQLYHAGTRSWCDLGCGIGRSVFLWTWLFDDTTAVGIEIVGERLEHSRARTLKNRTTWLEADFAGVDFKLPDCDAYYVYLATGPRFDRLLKKMKKLTGLPYLVVVESHGDMKKRLAWESWWLAATDLRFKLYSHRHDPWGSVYRKSGNSLFFQLEEKLELQSGILPVDLKKHPAPLGYLLSKSGQKSWELVIEEEGQKWTMDTLGLEWFDPQSVKGLNPPRQISWDQCTIGLRLIPDGDYRVFSQLRRTQAQLRVSCAKAAMEKVVIRKIFIQPEFIIEFSDGSRVPRSEIKTWDIL